MTTTHDIAIVGGGIAGAALACALAPLGLHVALIERQAVQPLATDDPFDLRVSAITLATRNLFMNVDCWEAIRSVRVFPIERMQIWEQDESLVFDAAELGEPCLGFIAENRLMQAVLIDRARALGVDYLSPANVGDVRFSDNHASLALEGGRIVSARLVVGADGAHSQLRTRANIDVSTHDYQQKAIVATVSTSLANERTAYQRFLPTGPLAFLPLDDHHCSIVWSTETARADELLAYDDAQFLHALQGAFGDRLGEISSISARAAFPLRAIHAKHYIGQRLALIGDAAHRIHPLAGQGLNLGLGDVAALAEVIGDAHSRRDDIGGVRTLRRYERWRKGSNTLMLGAMNLFDRVFRASGPMVPVRRWGLGVAGHVAPARTMMMRYASGLTGDLPRLAKR